ncbi:DNA-directed RNA polymerase III subunit RPC8 [Tanacetum coccineum]
MFNLTKLEYTLSLSLEEAVKGELESLFFDKVIANLGLCISVYDIESIYGGFIFANEGAPTYIVYRAICDDQCLGRWLYIHGVPETDNTMSALSVIRTRTLRYKVDAGITKP